MITEWYDSQLIGVLVGALLGFLTSFLPLYFEKRKKRIVLVKAICIEVETITRYWETRIPVYANYVDTLRINGPCSIYYAQEREPDLIFRSNAGNLDLLGEGIIEKLAEFHIEVGFLQSRMRALQDVFKNYNAKTDPTLDQKYLLEAIQKTIDVMRKIVSTGEGLSGQLRRRLQIVRSV
ncbi:MAG: hypothetical protein JXA04_02110 [Gammaproteobacteria bacterium]|nr:hypothetical protein [Gammaproteobacteria bacterium]